ncbi:polyprenyl synthetase family protein [Allorhizocola rhizosphaerae]|uniref:polyprenyl synthetase family protein n=1 Tax=Allorhizocola rhizosphaerae TaxID=1872709 RepID=UPI0013C368C5|nr:polyprenyl synthetase family protein [Allorhizocola rhizosphaerae]
MKLSAQVEGPFPFTAVDLGPEHLLAGARHTLSDFERWRAAHPAAITAHLDRCHDHLRWMATHRRRRWLGRRDDPARVEFAREAAYFLVYDMGEIPSREMVDACVAEFRWRRDSARTLAADLDWGDVSAVIEAIERRFPRLRGLAERQWLAEHLERLHRGLPEQVVRNGGMGKVVRAMTGVLAIAVYDTLDADTAQRRAHLSHVLPGAYALGAAYAIVDDTLQDLPAGYLSTTERDRCHRMILRGLSTGEPIDSADVPDHPLAEQLHDLYEIALNRYPFGLRKDLYQAAEAMYLAQHRDAARTAGQPPPGGLADIYPDVLLKAGLSRVIANTLGRRKLPEGFHARCLNTTLVSQFKDDLIDREDDRRAGRLTPFTLSMQACRGNPVEDMIAYEAYAAEKIFQGDPIAADALSYMGALKMATHLSSHPDRAADLVRLYRPGDGVARFLVAAGAVPARAVAALRPVDMTLKLSTGRALSARDQCSIDPRTFVLDRIPMIEETVRRFSPPAAGDAQATPSEVDKVIAYALDAGGKRLRPGLTLMLAESLGLAYHRIEPLLAAGELFHTASLLFDDLPAQDNATLRRGRPAAHRMFPEGSVQLAGIALLSAGFGALATLDRHYPAKTVTEIVRYAGAVLGPQRLCRGQAMDLRMSSETGATTEEILQMYALKTSTMFEAALVPVMMLTGRANPEIELMRRYCHHAGIAFQIRDDVLDATAAAERIGKDVGHDAGKVNIVRAQGAATAARLMRSHVDQALAACAQLPFDTRLCAGAVRYFATRRA